jgi:hypothetical protein
VRVGLFICLIFVVYLLHIFNFHWSFILSHWETKAWETCDIEMWGTTRDLGFPVTKDKDIVQSARDAAEGRRTNLIVSPEILRYSRQVLENEAQEEEPNECIRTLWGMDTPPGAL